MSPQDQIALDYFRTRTAYKLSGVFTSDLWDSIVYQASFAEPAVFHAVIALGAVHRNESSIAANPENGRRTQSNESLALQHYNKAIRHLVGYRTARAHLQSGLKLLSEMQSHIGRTTAGAARQHLDQLIDRLSFLSAQIQSLDMHSPIPEDLARQKELLQASLARWLSTYTASLPSLASNGNTKMSISLLLLRLNHTMASIMASTCLRLTDETVFDQHTQDFGSILAHAVELLHQQRPKPEPQLHTFPTTTDAACRIELLVSIPYKEGSGTGGGGLCARQVMEMEEGPWGSDGPTGPQSAAAPVVPGRK
ncbi:hypothetical protein NEMBOFW57_003533 [Staphylotrichum longicolle]|uniref:Uncharacterized protein n=1 Tax=Staphylotrichum longicolle TaxID=669026 RepID=A0AAD4F814_9PEZI|nr:hypothetical protein NEMBOFW57_003533 [Staphylotrichum longicolle]